MKTPRREETLSVRQGWVRKGRWRKHIHDSAGMSLTQKHLSTSHICIISLRMMLMVYKMMSDVFSSLKEYLEEPDVCQV